MSVVAVLGDLKKYVKNKPRADVSNAIFKLHRLTAAIMIGSSILTTSRQFFGDPIHCMLGGATIPLPVFQSYCFMTGTYTLPQMRSNSTSAHPGVSTGIHNAGGAEEGTVYHNYYQWVCLLLAVQASACYLPWAIWKGVEGGKVGKLLAKVSQDPITETPVSDQVASLGDFLLSHNGWFNSSALKLLLCQMACLVLTVSQMYAMDLVLGNEYLSLGTNMLSLELLDKSLQVVFPKVVKCSMSYIGPSGTLVNNSGMCTLPINIINEKIYLVLWVWFIMVACFSVASLLFQSLLLLLPSLRQMQLQRRSKLTPQHLVRSVANQSTYGDLVLLELIATNTDSTQFTALLSYLSDAPSLPHHQQSFMHESYHGDEKGLLAAKGGRKEV